MDKSIDLHLVSWNRPAMTELVIKTIHKNTKRDNFRLVVLDNASKEPTVEMLQKFHDNGLIDEFVPLKTNIGLEAARHFLLYHSAQSQYFVCVDNDCLPPPPTDKDWLETLYELMNDNPDYAAISAKTDPMIGTGNIFEGKENDDLVDFPHPGGSLRIMKTRLTQFVGGWDRGMEGRGQEERYICGKLRDAGFKTAFTPKVRALHLFGFKDTDRWGYDKNLKPEDTGHSDIHHPKLEQGDDIEEIEQYSGKELADAYARFTSLG